MTLNHLICEASVLELWEIWGTSLLPLFPDLLRPGAVVPVGVPSMGQIELFNHLPYLPTPPLGQDMTQGQSLSGV